MQSTIGYATHKPNTPLAPFHFTRRNLLTTDIQIEILYCGVCHSDIHQVYNEWGDSKFPMVPGHEIIGRVSKVGVDVHNFKAGDYVGVGCLVDSCMTCPDCKDDLEQFCNKAVFTYNSHDSHSNTITYGGYSKQIVVNQNFVLHISNKLNLAATAPLLCAGITTYSPLKHWKVGKGDKVGIIGLGGLGHMAIQFAHALGAHTVLFTTSPNKAEDAKRLGADDVVISTNAKEMSQQASSFDFILDTVSATHNLDSYTALLKRDGTLCLLGLPSSPYPSPAIGNLIFRRRRIVGSLIGGLKETQEMLDFCAANAITSEVEVISIQKINNAFERMLKRDVKYRFVIDLQSLKA